MEYYVPFAYEKHGYGRIPVEADSVEEAVKKAQEKLKSMSFEEKESHCDEYLSGLGVVDRGGDILDKKGNVVDEYKEHLIEELTPALLKNDRWKDFFTEEELNLEEPYNNDEIVTEIIHYLQSTDIDYVYELYCKIVNKEKEPEKEMEVEL